MVNKEALKQCKFYKGENECPPSLLHTNNRSPLFWAGEQLYVKVAGTKDESDIIENYLDAGLAGVDYDLPLGLLASIFALYSKDADIPLDVCAAYFKEMVYPDYIHLTSK